MKKRLQVTLVSWLFRIKTRKNYKFNFYLMYFSYNLFLFMSQSVFICVDFLSQIQIRVVANLKPDLFVSRLFSEPTSR